MKKIGIGIGMTLLVAASVVAGEREERARFGEYKASILKDPSLIRFYTFEEGEGVEVANHVLLDPAQVAETGGPLGSLTIQRYVQAAHSGRDAATAEMVPPAWTRGRWPWKGAVASGLDTAPYPWQVTKLFRSGITGAEFSDGMTMAAWIRIHENAAPAESCAILTLGDAWRTGFTLRYEKASTSPDGSLRFRVGVASNAVQRADLLASPVAQGVWHHVAIALDGGQATLYVDGEALSQKPFASAVRPTTFEDYPRVGPFFENNAPSRFGSFLMIAHNVPAEGKVISQFDMDELAIYKRGLSADAVAALMRGGAPGTTPEEQIADFRQVAAARAIRDQIQLAIPAESGGYFRIGDPITATVEIPASTGLQGDFQAVLAFETLAGKPLQTITRTVRVGEPLHEAILAPECGVYYLDMTVLNPDGSVLKRLAEKHCFAVVAPAPESLTEHNPVAFWSDEEDGFHYDAPIRRMNYIRGRQERFLTSYNGYAKRIPNLRAYLWFYYNEASTDEAKAANKIMFDEAIELIKDKPFFGIEISNEPHTKDVEAYVDMLKTASEKIRPAMPGIKFFPPGGSPSEIPLIAAILKAGGIEYVDGVSFHPYTANPIGSFLWNSLTERLKKVVAEYPDKNLSIWNTEGGINSLPRIKGRPMTRQDAHAARFRFGELYGHQYFHYFISLVPEDEAGAIQCHAILMDLYQGYQIYTICQTPNVDGQPSLRGVAVTALAGQVLNHQVGVTRLPLAAVGNMCLRVKQDDGSTIAAIFSMETVTVNLKVDPNATYKTMDMLGNFSTITANADGLITVASGKHPQYIFGVPDDMSEVVPLRLEAPGLLPENGILTGIVTVSNPFGTPLAGVLTAPEIPGAVITLGKRDIQLAPGKTETVAVTLKGEQLKRRSYLLSVELRDKAGPESQLIASSQSIFNSPGVLQMVFQAKSPIVLDGKADEWADIPETVCDDPDSLAHGKPNYAEVWVPQWANKDDLSFSVKTAWRKDDGIYFLLTVRDDVLVPAPADKIGLAFRYDCLEFFFDSREYRKQGTVIGVGADQVVVVPAIGDEPAGCEQWYARKDQNHVDLTCVGRRVPGGYVIEGKVTPNDRSQFRVQAGSQFRMDFLVDDADSLEPKLLRKAAMVVHGKMDNFINSDVWGRYELSL